MHRIKDGTYLINIDETNSKGTHWVSLFIDKNLAVYSDSFEIEYIPKKKTKSKINQLLTIYLEYEIMNLLCVDFIILLSWNICLQEKLC